MGQAALFEVNGKEVGPKSTKPFDNWMEQDTWKRYVLPFHKLLRFVARTQDMPDEERPPYQLTTAQGDQLDALWAALEAGPRSEEQVEAVDR